MTDNITMADTDGVDQFEAIAAEMLEKIFGVTWYMLTDMSTLSDFSMCCVPEDSTLNKQLGLDDIMDLADGIMITRFREVYGITVAPNQTILSVCQQIANKPSTTVH